MVTLDQNLAVNSIQAHIGDNVEIRCDISGKPQQPVIRWYRYNVDLASVNVPNMKVSIVHFTVHDCSSLSVYFAMLFMAAASRSRFSTGMALMHRWLMYLLYLLH